MAKIYGAPKEVPAPEFNSTTWREDDAAFIAKLRAWCEQHGEGDCKGKVISFGVADGQARYMVLGLKPVRLVHVNLGDGYTFEYAHRLTAKDVREKVRQADAMHRLFSKPVPTGG